MEKTTKFTFFVINEKMQECEVYTGVQTTNLPIVGAIPLTVMARLINLALLKSERIVNSKDK